MSVINFVVQIGIVSFYVPFYLAESLTTPATLACDYCNTRLESIKPWKTIIRMDDGFTVLIVCKPSQTNTKAPVPKERHTSSSAIRLSSTIRALRKTWFEPAT